MLQQPGVWYQVYYRWGRFCKEARKTWGKLTDDDLRYIAGDKNRLIVRLQERYGFATEEAANQVDFWADELWI